MTESNGVRWCKTDPDRSCEDTSLSPHATYKGELKVEELVQYYESMANIKQGSSITQPVNWLHAIVCFQET